MVVGRHAIRRYRMRIGKKNASGKRVREHIKKEIKQNCINKYTINRYGDYHIETPAFIARCRGNRVVTILDK